jgi:hypothetical protein
VKLAEREKLFGEIFNTKKKKGSKKWAK